MVLQWPCSLLPLLPIPIFSPRQHQKPGPQTSNGSRASAEQISNGVIFSWRVNPHYQHTAQNKSQPKSYFSCHDPFAASSTWKQQIHHMQEACITNLTKQQQDKANRKIQQKVQITNQEVPSNLQGFHKKFIIPPKPQSVQCTQPHRITLQKQQVFFFADI